MAKISRKKKRFERKEITQHTKAALDKQPCHSLLAKTVTLYVNRIAQEDPS